MMNEISKNHVCRNLMSVMTYLLISGAIGLTLLGCSTSGDGGPISANPSASTSKSATSNPITDSSETQQARQEDSLASPPTDAAAGLTSDLSQDFSEGPPALPSEEDDPMVAMPPTETGVAVQVTWDPSSDTNTTGYYVYYGKQPSGELGSCSYGESQAVDAPPAMITGLEPNTPYYFAISALHEETESPCSIEFMKVTPPAKS